MRFQIHQLVKPKNGFTFPYNDSQGVVVKVGRFWRKGWVKVCSDLNFRGICSKWYPTPILDPVYSDDEERLLAILELGRNDL